MPLGGGLSGWISLRLAVTSGGTLGPSQTGHFYVSRCLGVWDLEAVFFNQVISNLTVSKKIQLTAFLLVEAISLGDGTFVVRALLRRVVPAVVCKFREGFRQGGLRREGGGRDTTRIPNFPQVQIILKG